MSGSGQRIWTASRPIAGALLGASVGMTTFSLASLWLGGAEVLPDRPSAGEIVTFTSIFLTFPLVGFVVAWKRPDNPVGWLFLVIGLTIALSVFSSEYAGWSVYAGADMPGAVPVAWVGSWGWTVAYSIALPLALMLARTSATYTAPRTATNAAYTSVRRMTTSMSYSR